MVTTERITCFLLRDPRQQHSPAVSMAADLGFHKADIIFSIQPIRTSFSYRKCNSHRMSVLINSRLFYVQKTVLTIANSDSSCILQLWLKRDLVLRASKLRGFSPTNSLVHNTWVYPQKPKSRTEQVTRFLEKSRKHPKWQLLWLECTKLSRCLKIKNISNTSFRFLHILNEHVRVVQKVSQSRLKISSIFFLRWQKKSFFG